MITIYHVSIKKCRTYLPAHNFWSAWKCHFNFLEEKFQLVSHLIVKVCSNQKGKISKTSLLRNSVCILTGRAAQLLYNDKLPTLPYWYWSSGMVMTWAAGHMVFLHLCSFEFHCNPVSDSCVVLMLAVRLLANHFSKSSIPLYISKFTIQYLISVTHDHDNF